MKSAWNGKFAVFQRHNTEKTYGCMIYASGSVRNFATVEELEHFIKLNYPDSALPEIMPLEKFYKLMWQAIEKIDLQIAFFIAFFAKNFPLPIGKLYLQ